MPVVDVEPDTIGSAVPVLSRQRQGLMWSRDPSPRPVRPATVSPGAGWWNQASGGLGTLSVQTPSTTTAYWEQAARRTRDALANGGVPSPNASSTLFGPAFHGGGRPLDPFTERPYVPTNRRRRRNWARWVEQNGTMRLIPYDEETMPDITPYIGFVQDWGTGSFVVTQVDDRWRKRKLQYTRGSELQNPQMAMGWSPTQVTQWRDQVRFLSQWMDFGTNAAFGITGNDWTEADAAAMEWFMAWANENGTSVEQATATWLSMAQDGSLDNYGEQEGADGGGGGGGMDVIPPIEQSIQRTYTLYDLDDARAMLTQQIANLLGRQPRDDEVSDFLTALNTRAKANPTVTTYDYVYGDENNPRTPTETTTTVDPGRGIDTVAMARKEALSGNRGEMERFHLGLAQDVLAELAGM